MHANLLHVVTSITNPLRYRARYQLFQDFEKHVLDSGAHLHVVEAAFGDRPWAITDASNPNHLQLRTSCEMWHKENLLNLVIQRLPKDWKYVAWVDADVHFIRPDWAAETVHQLQHHPVVQMFSEAHDMSPEGLPFNRYRGFAWSYVHGVPWKPSFEGQVGGYYEGVPAGTAPNSGIAYYHHPGFAWGWRRDAFETVGGFLDWAVVGEADYIMAHSIVNRIERTLYPGISEGYKHCCLDWQEKAKKLRRDVGYVSGTLAHSWHGKKAQRKYWDRCRILQETQFDPHIHLTRDYQGLYRLHDRNDENFIRLRDSIRAYFRGRNEDSIDM